MRLALRQNAEVAFFEELPSVKMREPVTPLQWATRHRKIGQGASPLSMHGDIDFDVSVMPWCAEPMGAAIDPEVSHLVLWWASGMGKTDGVVTPVLGWAITESPRNIMALYPNENARDKWSRDVLQRTIDATPILRQAVTEKKGRESGNTISYKSYPGGSLYATAAGSASNLRGPRVGLAYAGEVDAMPDSVGREGDPLRLLFKRCEGFEDAIKIVEGTGTIKGRSRIEGWYNRTDRRKWFVPCRRCGHRQVLYFRHIKWPKGKTHLAQIECEECSAMHTDAQRLRMVRAGTWRPTAQFTGLRGYWINAINTTLPSEKGYQNKLHQLAKEWEDCKHSETPRESLRTYINTVLAETDEDEQSLDAQTAWEPIFQRRESYSRDPLQSPLLPEPVRIITAGLDVQKNRVEILFQGWARDEQSWILEQAIIHGKPEEVSTWDAVEAAVLRRYRHPSGIQLELSIGFIDRGDWTDNVDAFAARPALSGKIYTVKGASEMGLPIVGRIKKTGRGATYFRLGTDAAKEWIYGKLALPVPEPGQAYPPGFIHYPETLDAEFFRQLTAERAKTIYERGKQYRKFVKVDDAGNELKGGGRRANEALDISVYSLAAFRLRRWDWDSIDASIAAHVAGKDKKPVAPEPVHAEEDDDGGFVNGGGNWGW